MAVSGTCRLCRRKRELVRSHVIPELFYAPLYDSRGKALVHEERKSARGHKRWTLRKTQKGLREHLLCEECDNGHLNRHFERPVAKVWRVLIGEEPASGTLTIERVRGGGIRFSGFDYSAFKLLLLSILWRCSVSSLEFFNHVQLGAKHEERIRRMLLERSPGRSDDYPCILFLVPDSPRMVGTPVAGRLRSMGDHRYYRFYLVRCSLMIIVSSHFTSRDMYFEGHELFDEYTLQPPGQFVAPFLPREDVPELSVAREARAAIPPEILARYGLDRPSSRATK